jgi:GntR family transcriptional regulator
MYKVCLVHIVHKVVPQSTGCDLRGTMGLGAAPTARGRERRVVDHSGRPKYVEVAAALRSGIRSGTYPVGGELPSTARMTELFGVSTTVVRAAIRELRDEGLVVGQPGKAVYVRAAPDQYADDGRDTPDVNAALAAINRRLNEVERRLDELSR